MSDSFNIFKMRKPLPIRRGFVFALFFMSKPFAKKFYKSDAWIKARAAYISERTRIDGGLCERCGKTSDKPGEELHHITPLTPGNINEYSVCLSPANLQWLCKDCHFIVHREIILKEFERARQANKRVLHNGCYFDEEGQLIKMGVYIVFGSPASGKTTFVREKMTPGDLVVDLDMIKQSISLLPGKDTPDNLLDVALGIREYLYELIEERAVDCRNVWVIGTLPRKAERQELAERLGAEMIECKVTYHEAIARAKADDERQNKQLQLALIDQYFENYDP